MIVFLIPCEFPGLLFAGGLAPKAGVAGAVAMSIGFEERVNRIKSPAQLHSHLACAR
jgi:hypothetical protein